MSTEKQLALKAAVTLAGTCIIVVLSQPPFKVLSESRALAMLTGWVVYDYALIVITYFFRRKKPVDS